MGTNSKRPPLIFAVGMIALLVGGFLFFVYVGNNGRKTESFASRITFHSFSARVSAYYGGIKSSGASLKRRADAFMSSFWEEPAGTASAARYAQAAKRGGEDQDWSSDNGGDGDSFGKYYDKNYGGNSGNDPASWVDNGEGGAAFGGSASFGGGSSGEGSSGRFAAPPQGAPRGKQQRAAAGPALSAAAGGRPAPALRPGFGGPAAGGSQAAAPRLYASATARSGGQNQALQYGGGRPGNKLNGMSGNQAKGAGELDGATENARGDSQRSYNSKLGGGAASVAGGSGGGSIPAASGPAKVSGGAAGVSAAGGPSASISPVGGLESGLDIGYDASAAENDDLWQSVVSDTRNGRDAKYVTPEEAAAPPEESMLKSGGVAPLDAAAKGAPVADPKDFASLSPERKQEIKKNIHVFLKRIQNPKWFGAMTDIKTTSCLSTLDLCEANGISGNYLTITTEKAKLDLGVKYIKTKWRRYTIDVQRFGPSPAAQ
jgi:hypothetical protein